MDYAEGVNVIEYRKRARERKSLRRKERMTTSRKEKRKKDIRRRKDKGIQRQTVPIPVTGYL